jgi:hypothetical protein
MKKEKQEQLPFEQHLECLGHFNPAQTICKNQCVLRLRCIIEHRRHLKYEVIEEWVEMEDLQITFQ